MGFKGVVRNVRYTFPLQVSYFATGTFVLTGSPIASNDHSWSGGKCLGKLCNLVLQSISKVRGGECRPHSNDTDWNHYRRYVAKEWNEQEMMQLKHLFFSSKWTYRNLGIELQAGYSASTWIHTARPDCRKSAVHGSVMHPTRWSLLHIWSYNEGSSVLHSAWKFAKSFHVLDLFGRGGTVLAGGYRNLCSYLAAASHLVWLGKQEARSDCRYCFEHVRESFVGSEVRSVVFQGYKGNSLWTDAPSAYAAWGNPTRNSAACSCMLSCSTVCMKT